jgi:hypothetical protein
LFFTLIVAIDMPGSIRPAREKVRIGSVRF